MTIGFILISVVYNSSLPLYYSSICVDIKFSLPTAFFLCNKIDL